MIFKKIHHYIMNGKRRIFVTTYFDQELKWLRINNSIDDCRHYDLSIFFQIVKNRQKRICLQVNSALWKIPLHGTNYRPAGKDAVAVQPF